MDRLDSLVKYFQEKERKKLNCIARSSALGTPVMSPEEIRLSCSENNGYEAPELNDKLYLHFRGFRRIENLGPYTSCKALWLDSNGFDTIEGLETLTELRCLYLGKNLIDRIQGLDTLRNLHTLDLSYNRITKLENLSCCLGLRTLIVARNSLADAESISHLTACPMIDCLDLTNNLLEGDEVMAVLARVGGLRTLSITGNAVTKQPSFRKRAIAAMPFLGYLDRPIEELERRAAEAFVSGGSEAEARVREDWRLQQQRKRLNEALVFRAWRTEQAELRRKQVAEGLSFYPEVSEEERRAKESAAERDWEEEQRALGVSKVISPASDVLSMEEVSVSLVEDDPSPQDDEVREDSRVVAEIVNSPCHASSESAEVNEEVNVDELIKQAEIAEENERKERQRVIDESFAIFKRQRDLERLKRATNGNIPSNEGFFQSPENQPVSTWASALSTPDTPVTPFRVSLYWTLEMDLKLSALVKECAFDFDRIFLKMIAAASDGTLGEIPKPAIALISSEACRLRWCELDASRWSQLAPNATSTDAIYRICIDPEYVSDGKGGQLTFDQLSAKSAGSIPKYLVPPATFPSMHDEDDTDEDCDDCDSDDNDFRAAAKEMKSRQ